MQEIRVPLASNTLYVSGTVNGVDKVWTREDGNWWSTTSDKSDDGVYRVALSVIYGDGKTAEDSITLYYGLVLITDRTYSDVANGAKKGYYNFDDLNRVGSAMVYIRDELLQAGYDVSVDPYTLWAESDIPNENDMTLYIGCVRTIKSVLQLPSYTPVEPSTMENLTYDGANNIERILEIVDQMLKNSLSAVWYSDDVFSGEVI